MLTTALQIFLRSLRVRTTGFKKYSGDAESICEQVIADCWNETYFQASTGHFTQFWTRDFGMQARALMQLGWKDEVRETLVHVLEVFSRANKICTTVRGTNVFDFPTYAPDSLALLLHSLRIAKSKSLAQQHRAFLEQQISFFIKHVIHPSTQLVHHEKHFSSMKDHSLRCSSAYDNCMAWLVTEEAKKLGLDCAYAFPKKKFLHLFWNQTYFLDDSNTKTVAGDANVFPFWTGMISDKKLLSATLTKIKTAGLDRPLPLKYTAAQPSHKKIWQSMLAPNYEGTTVWTLLGGCYLTVLKQVENKAMQEAQERMLQKIEEYKTVLEVFTPEGKPYKSLLYTCDEGMLWAANILAP